MAKKLGVCLGAGGARGISHIGFLQALVENNVDIYCISGCSMGSLVGALFSDGYTPQQMYNFALSLTKNDIMDISVGAIRNRSILKSEKFNKILENFFGDTQICELSKPFCCIATDLVSGKNFCFTEGKVATAVRASCSLPVAFSPVEYNDMVLVDGGIINRCPVAEARALGADVVVAVDVLSELPKMEKLNTIIDVGFRALDIMGYNVSLMGNDTQRPELLLRPTLGAMSQYKVEKQEECYQAGYQLGIENIQKIKDLINS